MPKADNALIDTSAFGLATHIDSPRSKNNPHRSKWLVRFDTGVQILAPQCIFETMQFHLQSKD